MDIVDQGRRYKSKEKPCDACRKRKICCIREPGHDTCALCRTKSETCQFQSIPKARKGRTSRRPVLEAVSRQNSASIERLAPENEATKLSKQLKPPGRDVLPPPRPTKEWISQFVGSIEASLLFLQRHARYHRSPFTPGLWSDVGSLVGMSHDVGLNVDPSNWAITAEDSNRRIRLWWAVYIQDKWCALGLGRPSYINDEHFSVPLPTIDNFPQTNYDDLASPSIGILKFVGIAVLTTILSDILATFYSLRASERLKSCSVITLHLLLDQFKQRLATFHDQHLSQLYTVEGSLDPTGTVFLAFYTVQLTLYRAILRNLDPTDFQYQQSRDEARLVLSQVTSLLQELTVRRLKAFWWSQMSNINFSIAGGLMMSLLLTSVDDAEVEYWSEQINLYYETCSL